MLTRIVRVPLAGICIAVALCAANEASAAQTSTVDEPWSVPTPQIQRTDLVVTSGAARLAGTLYLPPSRAPSAVVVVFHGASDALRSAPLYRHLIDMLPSLGIGVFVYDRRGAAAPPVRRRTALTRRWPTTGSQRAGYYPSSRELTRDGSATGA